MLEQSFIDEYSNNDINITTFYSILETIRHQIAENLETNLSSIENLDWSKYSREYSKKKSNDTLMDDYIEKLREFFVFYIELSHEYYSDNGNCNRHHYINYETPIDLSMGIPKSWQFRETLNYTPLYDVEKIKEQFTIYKEKKWMHNKFLDLLFLKLLIYDNYSVHYFSNLFHVGINGSWSFSEAFTSGNVFKVMLYNYISPIIRLFFGWILPLIIFVTSYSPFILWPVGLLLIYNLIFSPYRIFYYFRYTLPERKRRHLNSKISLRIFDEISTSSFNPTVIKDMATENKTNNNIFVQSTSLTVIDHFIDRYGNSFARDS